MPAMWRSVLAGDQVAQGPIRRRGHEQQGQEPPVPAPIEEVAGQQEEDVLRPAAPEEQVYAEHDGEEDPEGQGVEQHQGAPILVRALDVALAAP